MTPYDFCSDDAPAEILAEIRTAILRELADDEVHEWRDVRRRLPVRDRWAQGQALVTLAASGAVGVTVFAGATFVSLPLRAVEPAA
ncbi:hypothetical protein [Nocardia puris]|uniref:hypothetical protein n=1 Tax=Nocardia puris TaxID=208602 RepID=UPI002E1EA6F8